MPTSSFSTLLITFIITLLAQPDNGSSAFVNPQAIGGVPSTTFLVQQRHTPTVKQTRNTHLQSSSGSGSGFGSNKSNKSKSPPSELFELQELRAQLETMLEQNILYQTLSTEKRQELTKYVNAVVEKTESPVDFSGKNGNTMGIAQFVAGVEGKSWRMVYSTDGGSGSEGGKGGPGELPYGSTVLLRIGEFVGTNGKLDYVLKFSKQVMGLNELVAKSSCSVDVSAAFVDLLL